MCVRGPRRGNESSSVSDHVHNTVENLLASSVTSGTGSLIGMMAYQAAADPELQENIITIGTTGICALFGIGVGVYFAKIAYNELASAVRKYRTKSR